MHGPKNKIGISIYRSTGCNIPEELNLQQHRCENLKTRKTISVNLNYRETCCTSFKTAKYIEGV